MPNYDERLPSAVTDEYWIWATYDDRDFDEKLVGKWMLFINQARIDEVWSLLREQVTQGKLGPSAKCSTKKPSPIAKNPDEFGIMLYTYDFRDISDVTRVLEAMRDLGIPDRTFYKRDQETYNDEYSFNTEGPVSIYYAMPGERKLRYTRKGQALLEAEVLGRLASERQAQTSKKQAPKVQWQQENAILRQQRQRWGSKPTRLMKRTAREALWITLTYEQQDDRIFRCQLTSNIPFDRGEDYFDMKVYLDGTRVYERFWAVAGLTLHVDVYENDGESTNISADLRVTEQAIEVIEHSPELTISVLEEASGAL